MGSTQVLCFLTLFAEDVDPDKVLRRYQWSRSGGQGLCDRCPRCIFAMQLFSSAFQSEHDSGCISVVRTEMQYVLYQRKIELRTQSTNHLLSSVDPVLYCDSALRHQRTSSCADCFIACSIGCFIGCFSVCFLLRLGHCGLCAGSSCFTERRIHCLCIVAAVTLLFVSFIMPYSTQPIITNGSSMSYAFSQHPRKGIVGE